MCPLDSAKIDSVCASRSRSSSRLAQRPRLDREVRGARSRARSSSSARSSTTTSAPCSRSASAWPDAVDADDAAEARRRGPASTPASASSNTAACAGLDAERRAPGEERVGRGLARAGARSLGDDAVDAHLEQVARCPAAASTSWQLRARRDDRAAQPGVARRLQVAAPSPRRPRRRRSRISSSTSSFLRLPSPWTVSASGGSSGRPSGSSIPREARNDAHAVVARLAVDVVVVVGAGSNGTNGSPVRSARARRKSSNISFQAAAWTFAVWVSTPSRSNRQARTRPGARARPNCRPKRHRRCLWVAHGLTVFGEDEVALTSTRTDGRGAWSAQAPAFCEQTPCPTGPTPPSGPGASPQSRGRPSGNQHPAQTKHRRRALVWPLIVLASVLLIFSITANWVQTRAPEHRQRGRHHRPNPQEPRRPAGSSPTTPSISCTRTSTSRDRSKQQLPPSAQPLAVPVAALTRQLASNAAQTSARLASGPGLVSTASARRTSSSSA